MPKSRSLSIINESEGNCWIIQSVIKRIPDADKTTVALYFILQFFT